MRRLLWLLIGCSTIIFGGCATASSAVIVTGTVRPPIDCSEVHTLPTYMQFLLDLEPEEVALDSIDTEELTRLAKEVLE